jgi:hypothetical protein
MVRWCIFRWWRSAYHRLIAHIPSGWKDAQLQNLGSGTIGLRLCCGLAVSVFQTSSSDYFLPSMFSSI